MAKDLDFGDLEVREISVVGPDKVRYILKEATARVATDHRNALLEASEFGPDGKVVAIKNLASSEVKFVAGCLFEEEGLKPVPERVVQAWPSRVQKQLYEAAKELSEFDEKSSLEKSLEAALNREDSPIKLEDFVEWVMDLKGEEFEPLRNAFSEDQSKN